MASFFYNLLKSSPDSPSTTDDVADYCGIFDLNTQSWTPPTETRANHKRKNSTTSSSSSKRNHPFSEVSVAISDLNKEFDELQNKKNKNKMQQEEQSTSATTTTLRIIVISDTHQYHENIRLPKGDILICCGDILMTDIYNPSFVSNRYLASFFEWFNAQPCPVRLFIGGNHDPGLEQLVLNNTSRSEFEKMVSPAVFLSGDEIIETTGGLRIFGNSYSTKTGSSNQAFQGEENLHKMQNIARSIHDGKTEMNPIFSRERVRVVLPAETNATTGNTSTRKANDDGKKEENGKTANNNKHNQQTCGTSNNNKIDLLVSHCNLPKHREIVQMINPSLHFNGHYHAYHGLRRGYVRLSAMKQQQENINTEQQQQPTDFFFQGEIPNINAAILASLSGSSPRLHAPIVVDVVPRK